MSQPKFRRGTAIRVLLFFVVVAGIYLGWVAAWSRQGSELTRVRLGVDNCSHCGMTVSELKYSISVLDHDEQGHPVTRHFDDPGCFQQFVKQHPDTHRVGIAHDFLSGSEIALDEADFVKTDEDTPMGSGIVVRMKR